MRELNLGWCCSIRDDTVLRSLYYLRHLVDLRLSRCKVLPAPPDPSENGPCCGERERARAGEGARGGETGTEGGGEEGQ